MHNKPMHSASEDLYSRRGSRTDFW